MSSPPSKFLPELTNPLWVRVVGYAVAGLAAYDVASNQFGLPKLGSLLGMSGSLLPWWGWLLALQAILMAALFEYVRRLPGRQGTASTLEVAIPLARQNDPEHEARQARRRQIIADGRRHIAAFNLQARQRHLIDYLKYQSEWPAIRPHLDPKVLRDLENGRLAVVTAETEKDGKIYYLMSELDRLEREWELV